MVPYTSLPWWGCVILLGLPSFAGAQGQSVTDYDRRAAATLYAARDNNDRDPATMNVDALKGLNRWEKNAAKKTSLYVLEFGGVQEGVDSRGLYRITVGEPLPPTGGDWTALAAKPKVAGDAEVLFKRVEKSDADKFINLAVRKQSGAVILTIIQRRPFSEAPETGARDVSARFAQFEEAARRYGLFGDVLKVEYAVGEEAMRPLEAGQPLRIPLSSRGPTRLTVRIAVLDAQQRPIPLEKFRCNVRLTGELAAFALGPSGTPAAEQEIDQPGREPIILKWTFPSPADKGFGPALEKAKRATADFSVEVEVQYKPSTRPPA